MPRIIDYSVVLERLTAEGMRCNYPNGGSFSFPCSVKSQIHGWIGPPDSTIRAEFLAMAEIILPPVEANLADRAVAEWSQKLPGDAWVMPASHWSFELQHGNGKWLLPALDAIGLNSIDLFGLTQAAAIAFAPAESQKFRLLLIRLLENLSGSDFTLAFPGHATVCLVHHHKQLWWTSAAAPAGDVIESTP